MANDIFATLRTYLSKVSDGDKSATEVAATLNQWLREGGEALKIKIEDEVERSVSKMGFVKRGEFEALKEEVARLQGGSSRAPSAASTKAASTKAASTKAAPTKAAPSKKVAAKKSAKKAPAKKSPAKKGARK
jgi:BMFP domain-containing protein YqiC